MGSVQTNLSWLLRCFNNEPTTEPFSLSTLIRPTIDCREQPIDSQIKQITGTLAVGANSFYWRPDPANPEPAILAASAAPGTHHAVLLGFSIVLSAAAGEITMTGGGTSGADGPVINLVPPSPTIVLFAPGQMVYVAPNGRVRVIIAGAAGTETYTTRVWYVMKLRDVQLPFL